METDSAAKTLSTFVEGFLRYLRPDGRLHPGYMLFHGGFGDDEDDESGTVTGRLSAKEPAFQTLPKKTKWAKRLRECYPAPPGKVVVVIDYRQGELKVVACFAPEPTMIDAVQERPRSACGDRGQAGQSRLEGVPFVEGLRDNAD